MIDELTQYPVGIFTTVQPFLFGWVLAISFFITVSIVALLMKGRTSLQIVGMSVAIFTVVSLLATGVSTWVVGVDVVSIEFISLGSSEVE